MAGIWEAARDGEPACLAVVTCPAGPDVSPIHDRQPVLIPRKRWDDWLAPGTDRETLERVTRPSPTDSLRAWEVSRAVNDLSNDGQEMLRPVANGPARPSLLE